MIVKDAHTEYSNYEDVSIEQTIAPNTRGRTGGKEAPVGGKKKTSLLANLWQPVSPLSAHSAQPLNHALLKLDDVIQKSFSFSPF